MKISISPKDAVYKSFDLWPLSDYSYVMYAKKLCDEDEDFYEAESMVYLDNL